MATVKRAVSEVIIAKRMKNPRLKANTSTLALLSNENPTITGMSGKTHGEMMDAAPAKKDSMKPVSILSPESL